VALAAATHGDARAGKLGRWDELTLRTERLIRQQSVQVPKLNLKFLGAAVFAGIW
jgi:hypothetical protein